MTISKIIGVKNLRKLLYRILKENKCYVSFRRNSTVSNLNRLLERCENNFLIFENEFQAVAYVIDASFVWASTEEGHNFWSNIHDSLWFFKNAPSETTIQQLRFTINESINPT